MARPKKVIPDTPEIYFVEDRGNYRVGRTDWPGDSFNIYSASDFAQFRRIYEELGFKVIDKTGDD